MVRSFTARATRAAARAIDRWALAGAVDRPVVIGGSPRSGTTLVRTMLHAHPDLAIPRETHFLVEAYNRRRDFGDLRVTANRRRLVDWLIQDDARTRFGRLSLDPEQAHARLMSVPPTLGSVIGASLQMYAEVNGATRWGDKRPLYVLNLRLIFGLFPDAQFINVVRDPRAVVASMRKLGWLEGWSEGTVVGGLDRWVRSIREATMARDRYRGDQFTDVCYERLLDDPITNVRMLINFCGLDEAHLDRVMEFHRLAEEIPEKQRSKFHPLLSQPLTTAAVRSWTEQLSESEVAFIEKAAAPEMAAWGYESSTSGVLIPADLERRWAEVEAKNRRRRHRRGAPTLSYPYPIAARITTAQRRRAKVLRFRRVG